MSYKFWLEYLNSAEKRSMMNGNNRRVIYKFPDGKEMVEEYSMDTGVVVRRAWRKTKQLMGDPVWEQELGEDYSPIGQAANNAGNGADSLNSDGGFTVKESNTAPILTKRITKRNIEWRIRNLPYELDVYEVAADKEKKAIIVRTTNKKYYKVIAVPELDRCNIAPEQANISINHKYNTLIITYQKPAIVTEMEAQVLLLLKEIETDADVTELLQRLLK